MSITQAANNKVADYEVDAEATDLLNGANIAFGALTNLIGFNTNVVGYDGPGAYVGKFRTGDRIIAIDTGRFWVVEMDKDTTPKQVLVLQNQGSSGPVSATGPDIVLVTADKTGKYAGYSLSNAVYGTLALAVAALPLGGGTIMLLDDTYTLGARLAIPDGTRLFSFSRQQVIITSADATGTLRPSGDVQFRGIRVTNGGGGDSIVPAAAGNHIYDECDITSINAAADDVAISITVLGKTTISTVTGGATQPVDIDSTSSLIETIATPAAGSDVSASDSSFLSIDTAGSVTLRQGTVQEIGQTTVPPTLNATGTVFNGTAYTAGSIVMNGCTGNQALANFTSTVSTIVAHNCNLTTDTQLNSNTDITFFSGVCGDVNALNGTISAGGGTSINGNVSATDLIMGRATIAGTTNTTGTVSATHSTLVGDVNSGSTLFFRGATRCTGKVTMGAFADARIEQSQVLVAVATSGGAIVMAGGTCTLIDSFVRASDTFISVSGTGAITTYGFVGGGCRFDTSGGMTVNTTVSDVRGNARFLANGVAGDTTLLTLQGTNEVFDTITYAGQSASGWNVQTYPARDLVDGFEMVHKNMDLTYGINVAPATSNTIDGSSTPITIGPNNFVRLRRTGLTSWITC